MATTTACHTPIGAASSAAELLAGISNQDPAAWEEIINRYETLVFAKVRSFHLQEADALDAVQMTWLRLAEKAHQIQFHDHLAGWLSTTAQRECLHILRHRTKQVPAPIDIAAETMADQATSPEQHVVDADTARMLWDLVAELPPRQRIVLRALFTNHPHSYAHVARTTAIPSGGIGPTRARALKRLRCRLDEHMR